MDVWGREVICRLKFAQLVCGGVEARVGKQSTF